MATKDQKKVVNKCDCPECGANLDIADDVEKGDILECTECGMELKVIYVNPVRVERIVY
jgi:alpha-aminoadipate carrier protein LysW